MIQNLENNQFWSKSSHRLILWIFLIIFTSIIFLLPAHLNYAYQAVESLYIFDSLPLFVFVYCSWMLILLLLALTLEGKNKNKWEGLALALIFSLVYLCFWTFIAPVKTGDGLDFTTSVKYISNQGQLFANIPYGEFPGLLLLTSALQQVTGISVFAATGTFVIFNALFLAIAFYLLMLMVLGNVRFALFGVLLFIQGNWMLSRINYFYPGYLGLTLLIIFLILLNRREGSIFNTFQDALVAIIILFAATITHFISSVMMPFILLGIVIVQVANYRRKMSNKLPYVSNDVRIKWFMLFLFLVIPIIWVIYYASTVFGYLVGYIPTFLQALTQDHLFSYALTTSQANLGGTIPLWANVTRWLWLFFTYAFGFVIGLGRLLRVRRLKSVDRKIVGGFIGITLFCTISFVISPGGEQGQRFLMYLPLCLVPIIFVFFINLDKGMRKYAIVIVAILLFFSSLPSFLAYNNTVSTDAFYPQDFSTGEFVKSYYGDVKDVTVFSGGLDTTTATYYEVPDAQYYYGVSNLIELKDANAVWEAFDQFLATYQNSQGQRIFIFSIRTKTPYQHTFGIEPTDPKWQTIEETLQQGDEVYNNGSAQIYQPEEQ